MIVEVGWLPISVNDGCSRERLREVWIFAWFLVGRFYSREKCLIGVQGRCL